MSRITASNFIEHRLPVLLPIALLLSSCLQEQPSAIEGTGGLNPPPAPAPAPQGGLNMTTARAEHTATRLRDGRVLIAGGFSDGFPALASAELYDPSSGTFTPTGSMTTPRGRHTATLLADGRILIAGGATDDRQVTSFLASAEIYDPSTGAFTATGNMLSGTNWNWSTLLPDGRVFIAAYGNAEIYDPANGTFALTGAYSTPTFEVDTAALLPDGRVLIVGCVAQCTVRATELFDPSTGTFSAPSAQLALLGTVSTSTLLTNGTVLFVESNDTAQPDYTETYDPVSGIFTQIGYTHYIHEFSTATRLPDGTVLIAGGQLFGGNGTPAVEIYLPETRVFTLAASLTMARHNHTATLLADGTVLVAGGYSTWPHPTASAEIYK